MVFGLVKSEQVMVHAASCERAYADLKHRAYQSHLPPSPP